MTLRDVNQKVELKISLSFEEVRNRSDALCNLLGGYGGADEFKKGMQRLLEIAEYISVKTLTSDVFFVLPCTTELNQEHHNLPVCLFLKKEDEKLIVIGMLEVFEDTKETNSTIPYKKLELFPSEVEIIRNLAFSSGIEYSSEVFQP